MGGIFKARPNLALGIPSLSEVFPGSYLLGK